MKNLNMNLLGKLIGIALAVFAIKADAQQKKYTGPFQLDGNLFKGAATYQYYENEKQERIYNGEFKFNCVGNNNEIISIRGQYLDNNMNGVWNVSINYPNDINLMGKKIKSHQISGTGRYEKGNREGLWVLKNVEKGNTNEIIETGNFKNNHPYGIWNYSETKSNVKSTCQFNNNGILHGDWINKFVDKNNNPIEDLRKYRNGILCYRLYRNLSSGEIIKNFDNSTFVNDFFNHYDTAKNLSDINNIPYRIYKEENKIDLSGNQASDIYVLIREITDLNDLFIIQKGSNRSEYENLIIAKDDELVEKKLEEDEKVKLEKERQAKQETQKIRNMILCLIIPRYQLNFQAVKFPGISI